METLRLRAGEKIERVDKYNKNYADKKRKEPYLYSEGDYVMVKNFDSTKGISPKLRPKFKGPYVITRALRNNRFVLADIPGFQVTQKKIRGRLGTSKYEALDCS